METVIAAPVLALARAGDAAACGQIYAALASPTLQLIRRVVGERALCEDIFQDTMMIMFERLPQYRGEAPFGAWLRQIAISRCLMYLRSPWLRNICSLALPRYCARPRPRARGLSCSHREKSNDSVRIWQNRVAPLSDLPTASSCAWAPDRRRRGSSP